MAYSRSAHQQNKMHSSYRIAGTSHPKRYWNYPLAEALGTTWL